MTLQPKVDDIVTSLREWGIIEINSKILKNLKGTTNGLVYTLAVNEEPKYVVKIDSQQSLSYVEQFHQAYSNSPLLPNLIYTDPAKTFLVYSYITGVTHYQRGTKINWLTRLVTDLLNYYQRDNQTETWGRLETPRGSWREWNERSLEGARKQVGSLLPIEDYDKVKSLMETISKVEDKYVLHGDTGVHNFVFRQNGLVGVIDPCPMVGPVLYDFTYAFCSSPNDINLETLFPAYDLLHVKPIDRTRLIKEVTFQLYCRIGICARVHPHDLPDYLKAWDNWKSVLQHSAKRVE